jgi:hypothetical protein
MVFKLKNFPPAGTFELSDYKMWYWHIGQSQRRSPLVKDNGYGENWKRQMAPQKLPDFSKIPAAAAKELCRQGELCLQGTVQLAVAADQRATTLTGILGAGSVALVAATVSLSINSDRKIALIASAVITALVLYCGALFCAWAARSADFHVAGYEPRLLATSATEDNTELWMQRYAAEDAQARIDHNRRELAKSARYLTWGRRIALCAVPIGAISFFVVGRCLS